jgi:ketosteroid isomerase-like protein
MSQENVEFVKALYPQPDADLVALFREEEAFARLISPLLTDDFESVAVLAGETRGPHAGPQGFRQTWLDWLEPWATYRSTIDELIDVGDRVVLLLRDYGRRKDMEAEVELMGASICTIRDGKIARWEDYTDRSEALEAVGLSE